MHKLGKKQIIIDLISSLNSIPNSLNGHELEITNNGLQLVYTYDSNGKQNGITSFLDDLRNAGIGFRDLNTTQSSLEEIFVKLVKESK